jgi:hypothetical protein
MGLYRMSYGIFLFRRSGKNSLKQDVINTKNWNYSIQMPRAEPGRNPGSGGSESGILKPFIIGVFTFVALLLHAYAITSHAEALSQQILPLFPLLYCIPIVLAAIWFPRRGLLIIGVIVGVSIGMILFGFANGIPFDPLILVYMAIYIWVVAAISLYTLGQWRRLVRLLPSKRMDQATGAGGAMPAPGPGSGSGSLFDGEDIESLSSLLAEDDPRVRAAAATSLGKSQNRRAVAPLMALLGDGNRSVREAAVRALGALGDVAVEPLLRALGDGDWHIRMGSAIALRIIGDPRAVEPLIGALQDENRFVRREAAKSLGRIGDRRATEPLISLLGDTDTGVKVRAAAALGKIGDPGAIDPLTRALDDRNGELQEAAGEALSRLKNTITSSDL